VLGGKEYGENWEKSSGPRDLQLDLPGRSRKNSYGRHLPRVFNECWCLGSESLRHKTLILFLKVFTATTCTDPSGGETPSQRGGRRKGNMILDDRKCINNGNTLGKYFGTGLSNSASVAIASERIDTSTWG